MRNVYNKNSQKSTHSRTKSGFKALVKVDAAHFLRIAAMQNCASGPFGYRFIG
jgi:hypothetical protein